jgi:hypothetical protein
MHIGNDGESYGGQAEITHAETPSISHHETSCSEVMLIPTPARFGCFSALFIRNANEFQRQVRSVCRHSRIKPIPVPRDSHWHVHEIYGDCGRWLREIHRQQIFRLKIRLRFKIRIKFPDISWVEASMAS